MSKTVVRFGIVIISLILVVLLVVTLMMDRRQTTGTPHRSYPVYPDPKMTPGDVLEVTEADVCRSGYTKEVRSVPRYIKKAVFMEYNLPYPPLPGAFEVDHFIPLELGGSNDIKNLWPEPAEPTPGFHEKDKLENHLHRQVCNGEITLKEAQELIRKDWLAVYQKYGLEHHKNTPQ